MAYSSDFKDEDLPEGITRKQVVNYAALRGSRRSLDIEFGEGNWGLPEIFARLQAKGEVIKEEKVSRSRDENRRYEAYTNSFDNITPNDEHAFRTLVAIEIRMEAIQADLKSGENIKLKELTEALKTLSTEWRQIQVSLGIDRAKRGDQIDLARELEAFKSAASDLVSKQGKTIFCDHCVSRYNMGFIIFHFRDDVPWSFTFTCPKCRQLTSIHGNIQEDEVPFQLETVHETQAADNQPNSANEYAGMPEPVLEVSTLGDG